MPLYAFRHFEPDLPDAGDVWVAPDAHLIGQVRLGAGASVWFGAVVRADNEPIRIGENTNVQENAVLHVDPGFPLTAGQGCTIGHGAIVHGCTLGRNVLVGMGATVLNGAVIEDDCLIGAGALVTEGKTFPRGSLIVGAPAKAIRTLSEAEIEGIAKTAQGYVQRSAEFRRDLKVIG